MAQKDRFYSPREQGKAGLAAARSPRPETESPACRGAILGTARTQAAQNRLLETPRGRPGCRKSLPQLLSLRVGRSRAPTPQRSRTGMAHVRSCTGASHGSPADRDPSRPFHRPRGMQRGAPGPGARARARPSPQPGRRGGTVALPPLRSRAGWGLAHVAAHSSGSAGSVRDTLRLQ
jgi:hypothetical protein